MQWRLTAIEQKVAEKEEDYKKKKVHL